MGNANLVSLARGAIEAYTPTVTTSGNLVLTNTAVEARVIRHPELPFVMWEGKLFTDRTSGTGRLIISLHPRFPVDETANRTFPIPAMYYPGTGITDGSWIALSFTQYGQAARHTEEISANNGHNLEWCGWYPLKGVL